MRAVFDKAKVIVDGDTSYLYVAVPHKYAKRFCAEMKPRKYAVEIKEHREKRSLDANAYYWTLLGKLHKALKISSTYCHNLMLRRYGTLERFDGKPVYLVIPDTDEAAERADEADTYHVKPTSSVRVGKDGKAYRTYMLLRGSHDYDTAEMSALIDGIVEECKQVGIETLTPLEIERMKEEWRMK